MADSTERGGRLRVLELFSGIGGMHRACQLAQRIVPHEFEVVAAVDVNTSANAIYRHNHPKTKHLQRNILGLTVQEINNLRPDMLMMSPPCQPHSRQGQRKDKQDPRSEALTHLVDIIPQIASLTYILVENVQGFEISEARENLMTALRNSGYNLQEFLVSPIQINIPNSRLRYYLIGKKTRTWSFPGVSGLHEDFAPVSSSVSAVRQVTNFRSYVGEYLEPDAADSLCDYLLGEKVLLRYCKILDIVSATSQRSCCFTKAYSQYFEGTGSVLQQSGDVDLVYQAALATEDPEDRLAALQQLQLRFFTPPEIARLLGFPPDFTFPAESTRKQRYKALGNSLNVAVVAVLLHALLT